MKKGILVALAGLALAVFAVPDAHAWWWGHHNRPDINLHAWGSSFISSDDGGFPTPLGQGLSLTTFQSGKTRGRSGRPSFSATTSLVGLEAGAPIPLECPEGFVGAPLFQTSVLAYNDGSLLSLIADAGFYCLNPLTGANFFNASGEIAAGDGRFEGATGTWEATGQLIPPIEAGLFTADLIVDFE